VWGGSGVNLCSDDCSICPCLFNLLQDRPLGSLSRLQQQGFAQAGSWPVGLLVIRADPLLVKHWKSIAIDDPKVVEDAPLRQHHSPCLMTKKKKKKDMKKKEAETAL
jgi:hypothetical protein